MSVLESVWSSYLESTILGRIEKSVWHIVLHCLEIEGTCESHKSSEKASSKSGCVGIAILLLQVSSDNKPSLVFEKISIFIKLVGEYPHQGYSINEVGLATSSASDDVVLREIRVSSLRSIVLPSIW
jgi:hypothetical protein